MRTVRSEWSGKSVSVLGAARSGIASARALKSMGAIVLLADSEPLNKLPAQRQEEIASLGVKFIECVTPQSLLTEDTSLIITSPGVPRESALLKETASKGIKIWSEIELGFHLTNAPIAAVTGTNGKTTTTLLIAAMLAESGVHTVSCGNISADSLKKTVVEAAVETGEYSADQVLAAEISCFQLEWVEEFAPRVGVLCNISPDHLDRYSSLQEYAAVKARLFANQSEEDYAVYNFDCPLSRSIGEALEKPVRCRFSLHPLQINGREDAAWLENGLLQFQAAGKIAETLMLRSDIPLSLPGAHSVQNVLAAASASLQMGASVEGTLRAVQGFRGVPHRMEWVADVKDVHYINNSMCTNISAALNSLQSIEGPVVVIAGGREKGLDYAPLLPVLIQKARHIVLIGETALRMEGLFKSGGYRSIVIAQTMEEAVHISAKAAYSGDTVILCPASSSFGMFSNFEERGEAFRKSVRLLQEEDKG